MAVHVTAPAREQTRARDPDGTGEVVRDGVRLHYEVYGSGEPTVFLLPTWSIVHSRHWKMQIAYFARHCRVITFDGRGNGRSDRPPSGYDERELAADALAVMDATGTERAALVSLSRGARVALLLAAEHADRVERAAFIAPSVPFGEAPDYDAEPGWAKYDHAYWLRGYRDFLEFFFGQMFSEPHSTKFIEDCVGWGLETTAETLVATEADARMSEQTALDLCRLLRCPVLVIQGSRDALTGPGRGVALAEATGGELVMLEASGHGPHARDPVTVNLRLRDFLGIEPPARPQRRSSRGRRALYVSSPIGLGHARRDAAIAGELRALHPDLEIDWLAQHPVTAVLEARGERVHPASAQLASESRHVASEADGHELHCFQAIRRMDEILLANFMVFQDVVAQEDYDLWIGDEAWELDYYLHENPGLKRAPYAWLTDFVGWLPMPAGGDREALVTADYNAQMIEHIAAHPALRDRAIFVGEPDDIVPDRFGPGLPLIRDWTEAHYSFSGYVCGFDPAAVGDRASLRRELGYGEDERVCVVSVGGSGVGADLLRRVIAAQPEARECVEGLRMIVVAGPRIDPDSLDAPPGVEVLAYVDGLYRHLAACDLAVVQGGLTTCMELAAARTPFLYFPLKNHFEQQRHVDHRLRRYRAGRRMEYETATVADIASAMAEAIQRPVDYLPVTRDGATRAARMIAELL